MNTSINYSQTKIVTSNDLSKRFYVSFYFKNERVREYNGKNLQLRINPNRATSIKERNYLLSRVQLELYKALESGIYPISGNESELPEALTNPTTPLRYQQTAREVLKQALETNYLI